MDLSASGYENRSQTVTRSSSGTQNFNLRPAFRFIDSTQTGQISGGSTRCQTRLGSQPCVVISFGVHHPGTIDTLLRWTNSDTDLDLDLYQGTSRLATSGEVRGTRESISSQVQAGLSYELRIYYYRGSQIENFTLALRRPS